MLQLVITSEVVGRAHLYRERGRQGGRTTVNTYKTVVCCRDTDKRFETAVTRDSSRVIFDQQRDRFGVGGECPPNRVYEPYHARIRDDGKLGFCLQLYEYECLKKETLWGQEETVRRHICIHFGPGCSEGCLMIAGGKAGYEKFRRRFEGLINGNKNPEIFVYVHERP